MTTGSMVTIHGSGLCTQKRGAVHCKGLTDRNECVALDREEVESLEGSVSVAKGPVDVSIGAFAVTIEQ